VWSSQGRRTSAESPDAQTLLLNIQNADTGWDIMTLPVSGTKLSPFLHSPV